MSIPLKNLTADGLQAALASAGVSLRLARRLQAAAVQRDEIPEQLPEVSPKLLARVREECRLPRLMLLDTRVSPQDGFAKNRFRGGRVHPPSPEELNAFRRCSCGLNAISR